MQRLSIAQPNFVFFGTRGIFSRVVLQHLLHKQHNIQAIVVPSQTNSGWRQLIPPPAASSELLMVPSFVNQTIVELGWHHAIPVWETQRRPQKLPPSLKKINPTAILVACWPARLPMWLTQSPTWGALNVHPSLLPHFRGPVPLFWQRRAGLSESGVTIHTMSQRLDEGDILAQAAYSLPDGAIGQELDQLAAKNGAMLLDETIRGLLNHTIIAQPQSIGGHYDSWPTEDAFIVPTTWSACHAYNFMQAANEWHHPFTVSLASGSLKVKHALSFVPSGTLDAPVMINNDQVAIQFTPGILNAQLTSLPSSYHAMEAFG